MPSTIDTVKVSSGRANPLVAGVAEGGYSVDDLWPFSIRASSKDTATIPKVSTQSTAISSLSLKIWKQKSVKNPAKYNYTSFGSKNSPFEPSLKLFYDKFLHFSSIRTFYEADNYDEGYAENRRHRRAIGKENQKFRDAMRREYTDTVRNLAAWVRKRDPRWQACQKDVQRKDFKRKPGKEENAKRRAEMAENYVAPEWLPLMINASTTKNSSFNNSNDSFLEEFASSSTAQDSETAEIDDNDIDSDGLDEFDDFYCVVCKKVFQESQTMEESWAEQKAQN